MNRNLRNGLFGLIRLPLVGLSLVGRPVYSAMFGWADRRVAPRNQSRLAQVVKDALPFLFSRYKARVLDRTDVRFPPPFDGAEVTVDLGDVLMRFKRGRGELGLELAAASAPDNWHAYPY